MAEQQQGQPAGIRQAPFGQGVPPGVPYGAAPVASGATSNTNRLFVAVGVGCGLVVVTLMLFGLVAVFWIKAKGSAAIDDVARMREVARAASSANNRAQGPTGGECQLALRCCRNIAVRSSSSAAAVSACEVFSTAGYSEATCTAALVGYRQAAVALGTTCE